MKKNRIALLDSGVGGLSVLTLLVKNLSNTEFIYFGDNKNAPYGNRTEYDLLQRTTQNIEYLKAFDIDAVVIACNTISMSILGELKNIFSINIFGVFPPVIDIRNNERALLLATPLTVKKYKELYGEQKGLDVVPLPYLARDIELGGSLNIKEHLKEVRSEYQTVILGCTHYFFVKNKIFDHLKPKKIICGNEFTTKLVSNSYNFKKSLDKNYRNEIYFIGENAKENKNFWEKVVKYQNF